MFSCKALIRRALLIALALVLLVSSVLAEAGIVTIGTMTFSTDSDTIDLGDMECTMEELTAFLDQFPNLAHVDMFGTQVEKDDIELLTSRYPDVKFGWTIHIWGKRGGHIVRTDQTAFSTLHGDCYSHSTEQLEVLKYCTELRALDLGHNRIQDISFLSGLTKMRVLILACNGIKDISPLANMPELEYVELFSNKIRDLSPLTGLTHLMDLNLIYNRVPDTTELLKMPHLKRLWVAHCIPNLKGKTLNALYEALPDTQVIVNGEPTQNGWRDHPHYDVLQRMFQSGEYIPFEDSWPLE